MAVDVNQLLVRVQALEQKTKQTSSWRGNWISGTTYYLDDLVNYGGLTYLCLQSSYNKQPDTQPTYWQQYPVGSGVAGQVLTVDPTTRLLTWAAPSTPRKNVLINPSFLINQRQNASVTQVSGTMISDGWSFFSTTTDFAGLETLGNGPAVGLLAPAASYAPNALQISRVAGTTFDATNGFVIVRQLVEGYDWARVYRRPMVLSFWAWANIAATYGGSILSGGNDRAYPFAFTVPASVWTRFTIPIPADSSGTYNLDSGIGAFVTFAAMAGTTYTAAPGVWANGTNKFAPTTISNAITAAGSSLYIAAPKLEPGYIATPFETDDIHSEVGRCLRRLWVIGGPIDNTQWASAGYEFVSLRGASVGTTSIIITAGLPVPMRANPQLLSMSSQWYFWPSIGGSYQIVSPSMANISATGMRIDASLGTALPGANYVGFVQSGVGSPTPHQTIVIGAELT